MVAFPIRDSRFLPLVTNVKPWVSMATPVRWTFSKWSFLNNFLLTGFVNLVVVLVSYCFFNVPVNKRAFTGGVVADQHDVDLLSWR